MKQKRNFLLGVYDLILSVFLTYMGGMMILGRGIFSEYPNEWISKLPFTGWSTIGLALILIFGLGNLIAAIYNFVKDNYKAWLPSAIMGCILFLGIIFLGVILREWYMATLQLLIFSILQICLSTYSSLIGKIEEM